jgi:PAS domain-containing protein
MANLLQIFGPKKKETPDQPSAPQQAGTIRPVIGPDKAALFLDSKGRIVSAQPRCAGFFGREPEELSGLNLKNLLKLGSDEVTKVLEKGQEATELSFHVLALRKDGSEFATQFAFKFMAEDFGFRWTVFVQAPSGSESDQKPLKGLDSLLSPPLKPQLRAKNLEPPCPPARRLNRALIAINWKRTNACASFKKNMATALFSSNRICRRNVI